MLIISKLAPTTRVGKVCKLISLNCKNNYSDTSQNNNPIDIIDMKYLIGFLGGLFSYFLLLQIIGPTEPKPVYDLSRAQRDIDSIERKYDLIIKLTKISGGPAYFDAKTKDGRKVVLCIDHTWQLAEEIELKSSLDKMKELKSLLDKKAITEEEYEIEKKKIINSKGK